MVRYNPVFRRWVLVGAPLSQVIQIKPAHLLSIGQQSGFVAAEHPKNPFLLDTIQLSPSKESRLYADQLPLGDYELLLYEGRVPFWEWDTKTWHNWLQLVQQRLIQAYQNPHLTQVRLVLQTELLSSLKGYQRVGDLVLTNHQLSEAGLLEREMAQKLLSKESFYVLHEDGFGAVYVPSAPVKEKEVWYIPKQGAHIEACGKSERLANARILQKLVTGLRQEFPRDEFHIHLHTSLGKEEDKLWWIRIHQAGTSKGPQPVITPPEGFIKRLALSGHFHIGPVRS